MGLYRMDAYKQKEKGKGEKGPGTCHLLAGDAGEAETFRRGARRGEILAEATNFARNLVTHWEMPRKD
jgi:hypothetical protein